MKLPWGVFRERQAFPENIHIKTNVKPGEFIMQTLFAQFTILAERKINHVLEDPVSTMTVMIMAIMNLVY